MNNYKATLESFIPKEARESVWLFYLAFSRFEYALKNTGFITPGNGKVDADWDRFAKNCSDKFNPDSDQRLRSACDFYISNPPLKQVLSGTKLSWETSHKLGDNPLLTWLLVMIRRCRNNLFHGGKFPGRFIDDPVRDAQLIDHSLVILFYCLSLNAAVQQKFKETIT